MNYPLNRALSSGFLPHRCHCQLQHQQAFDASADPVAGKDPVCFPVFPVERESSAVLGYRLDISASVVKGDFPLDVKQYIKSQKAPQE
jgi:hypothetical protein